MICAEMYWNGATIGIMRVMMVLLKMVVHGLTQLAPPVSYAAGRGASTRSAAAWRFAATPRPAAVTTT
jgi:hypothetical protein